ncbi:hypothetical protein U7230_10985 [Carboxydochorda subterranea]|uniref:Uncharacterized protein n=1 Tax=Carboxydichorda subterranea TaxID=3109565 RepID=A0ABZ1BVE1_9FIRM|nr:hypothetical protein [Limnochorda sp. L945t]WRP16613.1 hypothetical protein U7230_10985 [Limnochorda sp. L945t]
MGTSGEPAPVTWLHTGAGESESPVADESFEWAVTRSLAAVRESLEGMASVRDAVGRVRASLRKAFGQQGAALILAEWARRLERQAGLTSSDRRADQRLVSLYRGERRKSLWVRRMGDAAMEIVGAALPFPPGGTMLALAGEAVATISTAIYSWMEQPGRPGAPSVEAALPGGWASTDEGWRRWAEATLLEAVEAYLASREIARYRTDPRFGPAVRTAATL